MEERVTGKILRDRRKTAYIFIYASKIADPSPDYLKCLTLYYLCNLSAVAVCSAADAAIAPTQGILLIVNFPHQLKTVFSGSFKFLMILVFLWNKKKYGFQRNRLEPRLRHCFSMRVSRHCLVII